jgi:hypothetical protein
MSKLRSVPFLTTVALATMSMTTEEALARVLVKEKTAYEAASIYIGQGNIYFRLDVQNNMINGAKGNNVFITSGNGDTGESGYITCDLGPNVFLFSSKGAKLSIDTASLIASDTCYKDNNNNFVIGGFHATNAGVRLPPLQW